MPRTEALRLLSELPACKPGVSGEQLWTGSCQSFLSDLLLFSPHSDFLKMSPWSKVSNPSSQATGSSKPGADFAFKTLWIEFMEARIVFVLCVQSLAQWTPAYDLVLLCSGVVRGQISMSKINWISYWKALSLPCPYSGTEKAVVCVSCGWLFRVYTALTRLFTEAASYFCSQTASVTLLNILPVIITVFQPYQSHRDYFLESVSPVLAWRIQVY